MSDNEFKGQPYVMVFEVPLELRTIDGLLIGGEVYRAEDYAKKQGLLYQFKIRALQRASEAMEEVREYASIPMELLNREKLKKRYDAAATLVWEVYQYAREQVDAQSLALLRTEAYNFFSKVGGDHVSSGTMKEH